MASATPATAECWPAARRSSALPMATTPVANASPSERAHAHRVAGPERPLDALDARPGAGSRRARAAPCARRRRRAPGRPAACRSAATASRPRPAARAAVKRVPTVRPATARAIVPGCAPRGDHAGRRRRRRPSTAATTFERMPPEPRPLGEAASRSSAVEQRAVVHLAHELGARRARVPRVQAVGVGQQHEQAGAQQHGDLGRERVVVAERDLVRRGRVVLVDDRHDVPGQQGLERGARVAGSWCGGARRRRSAAPARRGGPPRRARAARRRPGRPCPTAEAACRLGTSLGRTSRSSAPSRARSPRSRRRTPGVPVSCRRDELGGEAREARATEAPAAVHERRRSQLDDDGAAHAAPA